MLTIPGADLSEVVRLHTDDSGRVWFGDDGHMAVNSGLDTFDFFDSDIAYGIGGASRVRILGIRANARLIVTFYQHKVSTAGFRPKVQLGSPALLPTEGQRHQPTTVLQQLWHPGAGMWHDMREADFCSYYIASELTAGQLVPEMVRRIALYHPAWVALAFINGVDAGCACHLLAEILDPRWYRHPCHPGRSSRLYAHLGLTPQNVLAYLDRGPPGLHYYRAELVLKCWAHASPHCFLWRITDLHANQAKGLLRASQRLIAFIREVWSYAVAPPHPEVHFDPFSFFPDDVDARSFVKHKLSWKPV